MRLSEESNFSVTGLETIHSHIPNEVYQQILKDVARSGSHISQDATQHEIDHFQEQLTQLMCWVLHKHSVLKLVLYMHFHIIIIMEKFIVGMCMLIIQNKIRRT